MNTKSILVLNTETIGLDKNSRIIEISTLDHNLSPHENPNPQHSLPVSPEHLFCHMWFIMWFESFYVVYRQASAALHN